MVAGRGDPDRFFRRFAFRSRRAVRPKQNEGRIGGRRKQKGNRKEDEEDNGPEARVIAAGDAALGAPSTRRASAEA